MSKSRNRTRNDPNLQQTRKKREARRRRLTQIAVFVLSPIVILSMVLLLVAKV